MHINKIIIGLGLILLPTVSNGYAVWDNNKHRKMFSKLYAEVESGNNKNFIQNRKEMSEYILYPYLQYIYLVKNINSVKYRQIEYFIKKYPDSPLKTKLLDTWLSKQASTKNWQDFIQAYESSASTENKCNYLLAKWELEQNTSIFKEAIPIWLHGESQPKSCDPLFAAWENSKEMSKALIWQRIKLSIQTNNKKLARFLAKKMGEMEVKLVELWIRTHDNPYLVTKHHYYNIKHPATVEIIVHAINKIARKEPSKAIEIWQKMAKKHNFTDRQWALIVKSVGIGLAADKVESADNWLNKIPEKYVDDTVLDYKLRVAIFKQNWTHLVETFDKYKHILGRDLKWKYWYATALEKVNKSDESKVLLKELASQRHYYGFLASHKVESNFPLHNQPSNVDVQLMAKLENKHSILIAKELYQIGWTYKANLEWRNALSTMSEDERQAAALLAAKWQIPNWAIIALADAKYKNDLNLRFPRTHSPTILKEARKSQLDPAWVFAITRQESAFTPTAKSHAGALGLMQMVPSTARMVAKNNNLKLKNNHELLEADKNIYLGTRYLKMLLEKHDYNPLLATAAYNAGPSRVAQWLPPYNMPSDQWIELIPYKETRGYVQNVITYMIIYQSLMGKKTELKYFMPTISMTNYQGY